MIMQRIAPLPTGRTKIHSILAHYAESAHGDMGWRGCLVLDKTGQTTEDTLQAVAGAAMKLLG